jgi:hypothetical protein
LPRGILHGGPVAVHAWIIRHSPCLVADQAFGSVA